MSLNSTPLSGRLHIGFFGITNSGKSSLVNALTNQKVSTVSKIKGTTTDSIKKAMELLPLGPVEIIDTPGFDDDSPLGESRIKNAKEVLNKIDFAILVSDAAKGLCASDLRLISEFESRNIKYIIAYNKCDLSDINNKLKENEIYVSATEKINIDELKEKMGAVFGKCLSPEKPLIRDILKEDDRVILVIPIDESAPKGRIILPQQLVLRELISYGIITTVVLPEQLKAAIDLMNPRLVITDSQAFDRVNSIVPENILLTSFSIIMARYKGTLYESVKGISNIEALNENDCILISEGCTHHRQCKDIGSVKLPYLIKKHCNKNFNYDFSSGNTFPKDLSKYKLIIHCGGCMLNQKEMQYRNNLAKEADIPFTNYGIALAYLNGILKRSIEFIND